MTSIPAGAGLDRLAAEAMGLRSVVATRAIDGLVSQSHEWWREDNTVAYVGEEPPAFSTDHATLPESFAWLTEPTGGSPARTGEFIARIVYSWATPTQHWEASALCRGQWVEARGDTLPEAVARLIVAVSLALAKETKR